MNRLFFQRKLNNTAKDFWIAVFGALVIANLILLIYLVLPTPGNKELTVTNIPKDAFKTGDNLAINDPKKGPKQAPGAFVASKNGQKYYPVECIGASRITDENKIWFSSKEEAESIGYTMAKSCY